jgi:hypothetical protein
MNALFIKYIKKTGAFVNPNDMTVYSYRMLGRLSTHLI